MCPLGRSDAVSTVLFSLWQLLNVLSLKALLDSHWLVLAGRAEKCLKSKKCLSCLVIVLFWNLRHQLRWVQTICTVTKHCHEIQLHPSIHRCPRPLWVPLWLSRMFFRTSWSDESYCHVTSCFRSLNAANYQSVLECNTCWLVTHKGKEGKKKHLKVLASTCYVCFNFSLILICIISS